MNKGGVIFQSLHQIGGEGVAQSTDIGPAAFNSEARMGFLSRLCPTIICPKRRCKSAISVAKQKIAMTSEATVISKPSSRGKPFDTPPNDETICRKERSFMSIARRHDIRRVSRPSFVAPINMVSIKADSRLFAEPMAWKSPVKCRLISSIGTTWA